MADRDGSAAERIRALSNLRLPSIRISAVGLASAAFGLSLTLTAGALVLTRPDGKGGARAVSLVLAGPAAYHALPEFVADLKTSRARAHFVQLAVVLELPEHAVEKVREEEVRIISEVQTLLREFERRDLAGAAGAERLRWEVLAIVDRHVVPEKGRSVLFTKFLLD
jgi:flagellar basal body-associated protein FliL